MIKSYEIYLWATLAALVLVVSSLTYVTSATVNNQDINILIEGNINSDNKTVIAAKLLLRDKTLTGKFNVQVETPGGSVIDCLILSQLLKDRKAIVTSSEVASSCGALLLKSGSSSKVDNDTVILLHMARMVLDSGESLIDYDDMQDLWVESMIEHYGAYMTESQLLGFVSGEDVILKGSALKTEQKLAKDNIRAATELYSRYKIGYIKDKTNAQVIKAIKRAVVSEEIRKFLEGPTK